MRVLILSILSSDEGEEDGEIYHDDIQRGMVIREGDSFSFVCDNLNEKIKLSSPSQSGLSVLQYCRNITALLLYNAFSSCAYY